MEKGSPALERIIFFIGWLLSPLTFWNDTFVNIPISYLCAVLTARVIRADFLLLVLVFYWLSNILGLVLMVASGSKLFKEGRSPVKVLVELVLTMAVYSGILVLLGKSGILKPF